MKKEFDCIKESRKWKRAVSKKMLSMTREERLAYLNDDIEGRLKALGEAKKATTKRVKRTRNPKVLT
jgi:uncharacterized small protein (DUF1192 family)